MLTRRLLLAGSATGFAAWFGIFRPRTAEAKADLFPVAYTDAEWRKRLSPEQYAVLRQGATEPPFSSSLLEEHRPGIFACAGCGNGVFSSETKFESGTGWPSFWAPLEEGAVGTRRDTSLGMVRTAVHCAGCGGHLGHVFHDGPKVTGLRYCINGVALTFKPTVARSEERSR